MTRERAPFDSYFRRYYAEIYRYVSGAYQHNAEDIVQETFATLLAHIETIEEKTVRAWLYKIATNKGIDSLRDARRQARRQEDLRHQESPTASKQPETQLFVRLALEKLPARQAQLLHLYGCGLSYEEMADVLEIQASSISQLLLRAKKAFSLHFQALSTQGA